MSTCDTRELHRHLGERFTAHGDATVQLIGQG